VDRQLAIRTLRSCRLFFWLLKIRLVQGSLDNDHCEDWSVAIRDEYGESGVTHMLDNWDWQSEGDYACANQAAFYCVSYAIALPVTSIIYVTFNYALIVTIVVFVLIIVDVNERSNVKLAAALDNFCENNAFVSSPIPPTPVPPTPAPMSVVPTYLFIYDFFVLQYCIAKLFTP
jgi:hypothetical protein